MTRDASRFSRICLREGREPSCRTHHVCNRDRQSEGWSG
jgi:hypothetical protein